tara:strand:- start:509 stop:1894 length:1386 start_codon:yes stop_codon:yes gene_type:complete
MTDPIVEWVDTFPIYDQVKGPETLILLKNYYNKYKQEINKSIVDVINNDEIEKLAKSRTLKLTKQLEELQEELYEITEEKMKLSGKVSTLTERINDMNEKRQEDKEYIMNTSEKSMEKIRVNDQKLIHSLSERNNQLNETIQAYLLEKNTTNSSHAIGLEGEIELLTILGEESSFEVNDTSLISHSGDAVVTYNDKRICIDSKKYNNNLPKGEVLKLVKDINRNDYYGGVIISFNSFITNPDTNKRAEDKVYSMTTGGVPVLLLSNASEYRQEINSIIKLYFDSHKKLDEKETQVDTIGLLESIEDELQRIDKEAKTIEGESKSHEIYIRRRKQDLNRRAQTLKKMKNMILYKPLSDEIVTENHVSPPLGELINSIADKHDVNNGQRNSTGDIKRYFELYCSRKSHPQLDDIKKTSPKELNKILSSLGYKSDKKYGLNYDNKVRKKNQETWSLNLSPDILN